jgi:hypothetical protein
MQIGHIVDYCILHENRRREAEKEADKRHKQKHPSKRKAKQADIDAFFG